VNIYISQPKLRSEKFDDDDDDDTTTATNNNNKGSRSMEEVCTGLTLHWFSLTQVCNSATRDTSHPLLCTQDCLCVVNDYARQEVGLFKRNMADLK